MGVTPIYHFDYTKFPFKFKALHAMLSRQHEAVSQPQINRNSAVFFHSPLGSMTTARDSFTMLKTREKTPINNRLSGANNSSTDFMAVYFESI